MHVKPRKTLCLSVSLHVYVWKSQKVHGPSAGQEELVVWCLFSHFEDYKVQLLLFVQRNGVSVWVCPSAHTLDLLPLFPLPVS